MWILKTIDLSLNYFLYRTHVNIQFKKDSIARKQETIQAHEDWDKQQKAKPKESVNIYYFKKSGTKLEFKNQPSAELENRIVEKANGYKKGKYSAYVTTTTILDKSTYDVKINPTEANF